MRAMLRESFRNQDFRQEINDEIRTHQREEIGEEFAPEVQPRNQRVIIDVKEKQQENKRKEIPFERGNAHHVLHRTEIGRRKNRKTQKNETARNIDDDLPKRLVHARKLSAKTKKKFCRVEIFEVKPAIVQTNALFQNVFRRLQQPLHEFFVRFP